MINNEELKLIIYRLHDCVLKNPKISTENLLKLSEFHKIPRYKVNFKMIQFAIALKKKKNRYLGINLKNISKTSTLKTKH